MYCKFLDKPAVPLHLILPLSEILLIENMFGGESKDYTIHDCQHDLKEYLKPMFFDYTNFNYQVLNNGVPIHIDIGRNRAINYIIDPGGNNVSTRWYRSESSDDSDILFDIVLPANKWHELKVDEPHNVIGVETTRYAITVY